jgi:hypothetical protein
VGISVTVMPLTLPPGAPPVLAQVAQRFAETSRGVVAYQLHRVFDVHGGFQSRHEDLVVNAVCEDGAVVRVRVATYTIDGKAASAADVTSLEQSWNHPKAGDVFAPPYDPRFLDAYQYQAAAPSTIGFTSSIRDAGHGNGSFTYDAQDDVLSVTYSPNALPPHARSGEVTDQRAEVLPGYWAVTHETQEYRGTVGPFSAAGTIKVDFSGFRRFPDLQSALRAL